MEEISTKNRAVKWDLVLVSTCMDHPHIEYVLEAALFFSFVLRLCSPSSDVSSRRTLKPSFAGSTLLRAAWMKCRYPTGNTLPILQIGCAKATSQVLIFDWSDNNVPYKSSE